MPCKFLLLCHLALMTPSPSGVARNDGLLVVWGKNGALCGAFSTVPLEIRTGEALCDRQRAAGAALNGRR